MQRDNSTGTPKRNKLLPFNVDILDQRKFDRLDIKPVKVMDHFDGGTTNFHEDGLFSISIFGRVGDDNRDLKVSYIDIKTTIFHPLIYQSLIRLKGLYKEIMSGKRYAKWDDDAKDFIPCSDIEGDTGYHFFVRHWKDIEFRESKSVTRMDRIKLIEKYKDRALGNRVAVIPAGLRDLQVDESGRVSEDEINGLYRNLIGISNTIGDGTDYGAEILNVPRHSLQLKFNEIYSLVEKMLTGKKGFLQNKWGSRRVFDGTRNVISSMDTSSGDMTAPNHPSINDTPIGLYQTARGALPLTRYLILNGWVGEAFSVGNGSAYLVDKKSLKRELVELSPESYDRWTTQEGVDKIVSSYAEDSIRNRPIDIEGRYLGLIYIGPDMTFKIFGDIDELPEHLDRDHVHPLTLCQMLYLSGYKRWNSLVALITRYPVTGLGSVYVSKVFVKTTVVSEMRTELGVDWEVLGDDHIALEFPTYTPDSHYNSLGIYPGFLEGLGGD